MSSGSVSTLVGLRNSRRSWIMEKRSVGGFVLGTCMRDGRGEGCAR